MGSPVNQCGTDGCVHDEDEHFLLDGKRRNCSILQCECREFCSAKEKAETYGRYGVKWRQKDRV